MDPGEGWSQGSRVASTAVCANNGCKNKSKHFSATFRPTIFHDMGWGSTKCAHNSHGCICPQHTGIVAS